MIQFREVHGSVLVGDRNNQYNQMAWSGMQLSDQGDYVIATDQAARVSVVINGQPLLIPPSSFLHVRNGKSGLHRHHGLAHDVKTRIGKLWAIIDQNPRESDANSGAGAIRG